LNLPPEKWNELLHGKAGGPGLAPLPVRANSGFGPAARGTPALGIRLVTFRYGPGFEFIDAIRNERPCGPSFHEGVRTPVAVIGMPARRLRREQGLGGPPNCSLLMEKNRSHHWTAGSRA